jgi:hypothetical protein
MTETLKEYHSLTEMQHNRITNVLNSGECEGWSQSLLSILSNVVTCLMTSLRLVTTATG